jgi:hypothetical protein
MRATNQSCTARAGINDEKLPTKPREVNRCGEASRAPSYYKRVEDIGHDVNTFSE